MNENKKRKMPPGQMKKLQKDFFETMGIDPETAFEVVLQNNTVVAKHVTYTQKDDGTMSGEFWTETVTSEESERPNNIMKGRA